MYAISVLASILVVVLGISTTIIFAALAKLSRNNYRVRLMR